MVSDDQTLGGAEMHSKVTGLVEYLAESDEEGIHEVGCRWWPGLGKIQNFSNRKYPEPLYSADEILGLIPQDFKKFIWCWVNLKISRWINI